MTQTTNTGYKYIEFDENNVPFIIGTRMKVVEIITSIYAYGWSAEELHFQYPHLTMSQIHSGLAYYWDNQEDIDTDMQRRFEEAENLRQSHGESAIAKRLNLYKQCRDVALLRLPTATSPHCYVSPLLRLPTATSPHCYVSNSSSQNKNR